MESKLRMLEIEQQHLSIVSEFAMDMLPYTTVNEVVWNLVRNVVAKLGFEDIVVYLLDETRGMLSQHAAFGTKNPAEYEILNPIEIPIGKGVVGTVAQTREPLLVEDTRDFDGYIVDEVFRLSELAVPMMAEGKLVGVIDSENHQKGFFTAQHQRTLTALASIAATKILKAQNHERLQQTIEALEYSKKVQDTLFEISELTFNAKALSVFYRGLQQCIGQLMFSENFFVALACRDGKSIRFAYNIDEFDNIPIDKTFALDQRLPGITEYVLNTNEPLLLSYQDMIGLVTDNVFTVRGKIPKSWLAVPFGPTDNNENTTLKGVVAVQHYYNEQAFGEKEKQILMFVAKHIRNAIERVNAAKALKLTNENLQKSNTQLEEARKEAEQASALKSTFVANISHEIRTPLTAIIGFTEQALKHQGKVSQQRDFLNRVLKSGRHLLELINEILDLSKIEADKLELGNEAVDLFELVESVESVTNVPAVEKSLIFDVVYHFPLPRTINSDAVRLKQVLLNLCNNAVKFTIEGQVRLYLTVKDEHLLFEVSDTGIGMSEEELCRLFKPFVQADSNINRQFGGTGLGLVISKKLTSLMGGEIWVDSEKGKGSCFTVAFPFDKTQVQWVDRKPLRDTLEHDKNEQAHSFTYAKILVAEDNHDNQFLIKTLLSHIGAEVCTVGNGQKAVEAAMFDDYDLILMDIQMPVMDGCEAVKLMRHGGIDCPIIALTANIMKEDVDKYMANGFSDTLAKPIQLQSFYKKLNFYLEQEKSVHGCLDSLADEINNDDEIKKLKAQFKASLAGLKQDFARMAQSDDWQSLKDKAHQVKGSAGSMGFSELTGFAADIEHYLKQQQYDKAREATEQFIAQCEQSL